MFKLHFAETQVKGKSKTEKRSLISGVLTLAQHKGVQT